MASKDDTSKPRRSRSVPPEAPAAAAVPASPAGDAPPPPVTPPRTLEEAIENARTLMLELRAMLHCLSDVLLYADDDDSVMHAEVARSASNWGNYAAAELDLMKLRPLIEVVRQRGGGTPEDGDSNSSNAPPYQVREPRLEYAA